MSGQIQTLATPPPVSVQTLLYNIYLAAASGGSGGASWGSITGTLSAQTDLQSALDAKLNLAGGTMTGALVNSTNGAASTPSFRLSGSLFTGGTGTTTKPLFLIEPTGTTSNAWNTSGTMLGVNAASGFTGNLLDIQKNGVSEFLVDTASGGFARVKTSIQFGTGAINSCGISVHSSDNLLFTSDDEYVMKLYNTRLLLQSTAQFAISASNAYNGTADVGFARSSAGVARVSNGSTGRGTLDAAGYQVGGVAGAAGGTFTAITSITVVNGIITAISGT